MAKIYTFNDKIITINNKWAEEYVEPAPTPVDPYNPLGLPANTIRVKFKSGYTPSMGESQTLVDSTNNVWDIYNGSAGWTGLFMNNTNLLEVLGANTSNVIGMYYMFGKCSSLTTVPLFDTSNVTGMGNMFQTCTNLTSVPLFDTTNVTNMSAMFYGCTSVESGALALYQQASSQANPPSHESAFYSCGSNTQTGAAELAQIPSDWK